MKHPIPEFLKKAVMASVLALMPAAAIAQEQAVVMLGKDGSTYELALSEVSRIDFGTTEVTLTGTAGQSKAMPYNDINRILIGSPKSGIANLIAKGEVAVYPSVTAGPLTIEGVEGGTEIAVYDLNGVLVRQTRATDTTVQLDLSDVAPGMMIVRVGKYPVKIIKK